MAGQPLQVVDKEKDIGVIISDNLKPSLQCANASRRATAVLTQISRAFMYWDKNTFLHLEFAIPAWSPWLVRDFRESSEESCKNESWITGQNIGRKII